MKPCDHTSVGAVIFNEQQDGILLFLRGTEPYAWAGPAGHCDGDQPLHAVIKEVSGTP